MKNPFNTVTSVFQSPELLLLGAHACASVYELSQGRPPASFPLKDPDGNITLDFKLNAAGIVATDSAASILAIHRDGVDANGNVSAGAYVKALQDIKEWNLTEDEDVTACHTANATWRTTLFTVRTEERWTRAVNTNFNLLPPEEKQKDRDQLQAAATFLLEQIETE